MVTVAFLFLCAWFDWKTLKTEDFTVIYRDGYQAEALQALANLHYYADATQEIIAPYDRRIPVVIEDVGAVSNGYANPVFHNIHIFTHTPGFGSQIESIESWYRTVGVHEYAHIVHLGTTAKVPRVLTNVFGPLFAPNIYSPGWITEGITVLSESRSSPYEGRLNDGFFDACVAARAAEGALLSIVEATNTPLDFPQGSYYLYGGEFFGFLYDEYGPERLAEFFKCYGSCVVAPLSVLVPATGLDRAARKAFGASWPRLFRDWQHSAQEQFHEWRCAGTRMTDVGWYAYSLIEGAGVLYYVRSVPVKLPGFDQNYETRLMRFDPETGEESAIATLSGNITSPLRVKDGRLYYTMMQWAHGYANVNNLGYGVTVNLHARDLLTGEDRIILTDDIRGFCVLDDGRVMYSRDRLHDFGSEIWITDGSENTFLLETDLLVNELEACGHRIVISARCDYENWDIFSFDRETCEFTPIIAAPWAEGSIALEGDTLIFTANYNKAYSIYMYDLATDSLYRLTDAGYADRGVMIQSSIFFLGISREGFDIYAAPCSPVPFERLVLEPSTKPDLDALPVDVREGGYGDVLKTLAPSVRIPFIAPTNSDLSEWTYGALFAGGDATDENMYAGFVARDPTDGSATFDLLWQSRFVPGMEITALYDHSNAFEYALVHPAYLSLEYGLSSLIVSVSGRVFDSMDRHEVGPGISLRWEYPHTTLGAHLFLPFERESWGSSLNRSGQYLGFSVRRIMGQAALRLACNAYVDRNEPDVPSFCLRGYEAISAPRAVVFRAEFGSRLLRVRQGLWNPNIYFEDLFWNVFVDYAWTDGGATHYSTGVELLLEVKTGFGFIQVLPKVGACIKKTGTLAVFFGLYPQIPL